MATDGNNTPGFRAKEARCHERFSNHFSDLEAVVDELRDCATLTGLALGASVDKPDDERTVSAYNASTRGLIAAVDRLFDAYHGLDVSENCQ